MNAMPFLLSMMSVSGGLRYYRYPFPTGRVYLFSDDDALRYVHIGYPLDESALDAGGASEGGGGAMDDAIAFLDAYLLGRVAPAPKLDFRGFTHKTRSVYEALLRVPFGSTVSYGALARSAGIPGGARFVGTAMARNRFPLFIPCHRVVRGTGAIGGFSGGIAVKRFLLEHERVLASDADSRGLP